MQDFISNNLIAVLIVLLSTGLLALVFSIVALFWLGRLKKRNELLFAGKRAGDLEQIILDHSKSITELDKEIQQLFEISNKIHSLSFKGLHKFGIIRFNPFKDIGGNQSFALAILDGKNSGMVLSSLHTREGGTRIYAKPINKGKCEEFQLTEEETKAIANAMLEKNNKI